MEQPKSEDDLAKLLEQCLLEWLGDVGDMECDEKEFGRRVAAKVRRAISAEGAK